MKRILIGSAVVVSLLSATSAFAADLAARPYTKAPIYVDPGYNWTGFYVGGNVGYSWGRSSSTQSFIDTASGAILNSNAFKFDMNGIIGGGQIGYNWQKDKWVFGLEADIQGSAQKGNGNALCPGGPATSTTTTPAAVNGTCTVGHIGDTVPFNVAALPVTNNLSEKLEWFGTVRGRIGPTITPTILAYVTGGLAYGEVRATNTVTGTNLVGAQNVNTPPTFVAVFASSSNTFTKVGWTVGAGIEGVVSGNWTAKIEYLYMDLGNVSGSFVTPIIATSGAFVTSQYSSHITDNILRIGVNYKWGGPVVATY
jgi:outer membrane immunogenic protein